MGKNDLKFGPIPIVEEPSKYNIFKNHIYFTEEDMEDLFTDNDLMEKNRLIEQKIARQSQYELVRRMSQPIPTVSSFSLYDKPITTEPLVSVRLLKPITIDSHQLNPGDGVNMFDLGEFWVLTINSRKYKIPSEYAVLDVPSVS